MTKPLRWGLSLTVFLLLSMLTSGCGRLAMAPVNESRTTVYLPEQTDKPGIIPVFRVEESQESYNRIGRIRLTPADDDPEVFVDPEQAAIYFTRQPFTSKAGRQYTNLIYRIHFSNTPLWHLTSGKNVGLFLYITLNDQGQPVLISTVHTCGCYLSITPTSFLPKDRWPAGWKVNGQEVLGESLPSYLELPDQPGSQYYLEITLKSETHRVRDIKITQSLPSPDPDERLSTPLLPMSYLTKLPNGQGKESFFEEDGLRRGHVRDSRKPLEMLLMSWWAFDPFVGEDKALGPEEETGARIYTSLKFWARERSSLWNFADFLDYWDWKL